ncbi:phosphatase PAP2 family protein [Arthrobacter crystallopoietes]|uniref:phosphatase PAP2 family protein n=1 Tax=Crystallibacter crystallopoietes TaxID=37928 RepID=UPI003D1D0D04
MDSSKHKPPGGQGVAGELRGDRLPGGRDPASWHSRFGRFLASAAEKAGDRLGPNPTLILLLAAGVIIAVVLTAAFAGVYDAVTEGDGVAELDHPMLAYAKTLRSPGVDLLATAYTDLGGTVGMPILAVLATVTLAWHRRSWTPVILIPAAALGSLLMTVSGKPFFGRSRPALSDAVPPYEHSASFPSGHALNSIVIAGIVAYLIILRLRSRRGQYLTIAAAGCFALLMGLSRVFLGHHWFTDVLAAWALGAAWLAVVITAHRMYLTVRHRTPH